MPAKKHEAPKPVELPYGFSITVFLDQIGDKPAVYIAQLHDPLGNVIEEKRSGSSYTTSKNIEKLRTRYRVLWSPDVANRLDWDNI
jgi:hypothetical protein